MSVIMPKTRAKKSRSTIFTIGHSTRTLDEFIAILHAHGVRAVADVRLIPKSRRYPHFSDESLAKELPKANIEYHPFKSLGGRRRPDKHSINLAWRNESFRGYADFMQTPAFADALEELMTLARKAPTTTMCAEAVPWRCHRSLISDALLARGWEVLDIMSETKAPPHKLPKFAEVEGTTVTYPAEVDAHGLFAPEPAPGDLL
jgi:uncharacterized protein (DUF488 family)